MCDGKYIGGNRNSQRAVCKCFKPKYAHFERNFVDSDKLVTAKCIEYAEDWNVFCAVGMEITINQGDMYEKHGRNYLGKCYP